jgi:hypothetical protein
MKALRIFLTGITLFLISAINAQDTAIANTCTLPEWNSVAKADVRYFYLPELGIFYDVNSTMFIYNNGKGWIHQATLPEKNSGYDLFCCQKIMITGKINFDEPKTKFARDTHNKEQRIISKNQEKWDVNKESSLVDSKSSLIAD